MACSAEGIISLVVLLLKQDGVIVRAAAWDCCQLDWFSLCAKVFRTANRMKHRKPWLTTTESTLMRDIQSTRETIENEKP